MLEQYFFFGTLLAGLQIPAIILSTILIKKNPDAIRLLGVSGILTVALVLAWPVVLVLQAVVLTWKVEI